MGGSPYKSLTKKMTITLTKKDLWIETNTEEKDPLAHLPTKSTQGVGVNFNQAMEQESMVRSRNLMDEFLEDHDLTENTIEFTQGTGMTPVTGRSDF